MVDISFFQSLMDAETWAQIADKFGVFGPIIGIILPMIESFFPPLPLSLVVTTNVIMFGPFFGYMYSWIGTCIGSMIVYLLLSKYGRKKFSRIEKKYQVVANASNWVKHKGGIAIFILLCFPFTPSIAVAVLSALTGLSRRTYLKALISGKMIMILLLSIIGYNIFAAIEYPFRLIGILASIAVLYFLTKKSLDYYQKLYMKKQIKMD